MTVTLDSTDWALLAELQRDARASVAQLARAVSMSASAVTERMRRLEQRGVVRGYRAELDLAAVGYPVLAFVRLKYPHGNYKPFHDLVGARTEILEAHHVTGDDCFVIKVAARSMPHLEEVVGAIASLGGVSTSVVYSTSLPGRVLTGPPGDRPGGERRGGASQARQGRSKGGGAAA
jgi:Lrp/AsnC family transcriptional regulator, leucine-responsive regulatory protein